MTFPAKANSPAGASPAALAAVAACLFVALAAVAWPGSAGSAPLRAVVLGETSEMPRPACPTSEAAGECQAIATVTGFQSLAGDVIKPFEAPYEGKLVSWSISLSRPNGKERAFFDDAFGRPPTARIAVLRPIEGERPPKYVMVRQGPMENLTPYLGTTVEFALTHPLTVLRGHMVALTIPTWAPALAINLPGSNTWRGSRKADACSSSPRDIEDSRPQQRVGSKKEYGCYFSTSRLLYTATLVKKPGR